MTKSSLISILLAALIVLCPIRCMFGGCLAGDELETTSAVSSCCPCSQSDNRDESPLQTPDDCGCGDCFCHGALPVNETTIDLVVAEFVLVIFYGVAHETTLVCSPQAQIQPHSLSRPINASAQEVRAALCCWII